MDKTNKQEQEIAPFTNKVAVHDTFPASLDTWHVYSPE